MGAIAEGFVAFAQPLLDQTDGSMEQLHKAMSIAQVCFNLALLPEASRHEAIGKMQGTLDMDDEEFAEFRSAIIVPMIRRHEEMFPRMHRRVSVAPLPSVPSPRVHPPMGAPAEKRAVTDRYAPCPCNSGKKYKFCCGKKGR
jgi:hypothetical protein